MKLRNGMLKIMGVLWNEEEKKKKKHSSYGKKKKLEKKKARTGFEPAIFGLPWQPSRCLTRPTPYHLATEPLTHIGGKIKSLKPSTQNAH